MVENLKVCKLYQNAIVPTIATFGSAGFDLYSIDEYEIVSGQIVRIQTGIEIEFPKGYFGKIFDRSSLALKGFSCFGGVIDNDYRGEIIIIGRNLSAGNLEIGKYSKVAQLVCIPYITPNIVEVFKLSETSRGSGGFGSTGI